MQHVVPCVSRCSKSNPLKVRERGRLGGKADRIDFNQKQKSNLDLEHLHTYIILI